MEVTVDGSEQQNLRTLLCSAKNVRCKRVDDSRFRLVIPADVVPGLYDLRAVGDRGISSPRTFVIGNRAEQLEPSLNEEVPTQHVVPLDVVVNGRIDKAHEADIYRFAGKQRQRVAIECWAERIDSRLRAVIELFDAGGRRLSVNRGFFGIDPLIDFHVPSDGTYTVRITDLTSTGSPEHYYRLDSDAHTVAAGIRVPAAVGDFLILRAVRESGGFATAVDDASIITARDDIAEREGLLICPEGAATYPAYRKE